MHPNLILNKEARDLITLRKALDFLCDGNQTAFGILLYIKGNFVQWQEILIWMKRNDIRGQKMVEFFQNESDATGGGYLMGVTTILSRIKGHKDTIVGVKANELS